MKKFLWTMVLTLNLILTLSPFDGAWADSYSCGQLSSKYHSSSWQGQACTYSGGVTVTEGCTACME